MIKIECKIKAIELL